MATRLFPPGSEDVLYLVDLSGYVYRAFHALPDLSSPSGEPSNAVFGTVTMLERLLRQCDPRLVGVAREGRGKNFRYALYPEYKSSRPPTPEALRCQFDRVIEVVEAFNLCVLESEEVEADDVIASAVKQARAQGKRVVIVSADKDLMQLVGEDVVLWDTMRDRVFGPPEVEERFGVRIPQIRDALALMGDASDSIPGVPSVGPKTAAELLQTYGTLEVVYAKLDQISKKRLRETLAQYRDQAFLSQTLVTLKEDCGLVLDWAKLRYSGRNVARLREIYTELGFQRLLSGLGPDTPAALPSATPPTGLSISVSSPATVPALEPQLVLDSAQFQSMIQEIENQKAFAVRVETCSLGSHEYRLAGMSIATEPGRAFYVPLGHRALGSPRQLTLDQIRQPLDRVLQDPGLSKWVHDAKRTEVVLRQNGLGLEGVAFDTLLAAYLLEADDRGQLSSLAATALGLSLPRLDDLIKGTRGHKLDFDEVPVTSAASYSAQAAEATLRLRSRLASRLADEGLTDLNEKMELPLSRILAQMEALGVLVDSIALGSLSTLMDQELSRLEQAAYQAAQREFNVNSPRQLETLLFDELKLKPVKRTKTARSTDAETLEALAEEHELPRIVLEHRQIAKLKSTYVDALPTLVNPRTGRVHTCWEQAIAATGRLSSTEPNLQNIPVRTELGRSIRAAFVAPPGYRLVSADYSQIELRVLAHLAQDPVLLEAFQTGQDIHARTAMEIFEVSPEELTAEMRRRAKAVNFGIIYGQGDSGLAKSLGISRMEAGSFIAAYYRRYHGVRRFMEETLDRARVSESVRTLLGRRRLLPDIRNSNRARRLAAERIAMNTPIQGTAADLLKLAMLALKEPVTPGSRMILTVHDELVFEIPEDEVPVARERIRSAMENIYPLAVPLVVDLGEGPSWREAH